MKTNILYKQKWQLMSICEGQHVSKQKQEQETQSQCMGQVLGLKEQCRTESHPKKAEVVGCINEEQDKDNMSK